MFYTNLAITTSQLSWNNYRYCRTDSGETLWTTKKQSPGVIRRLWRVQDGAPAHRLCRVQDRLQHIFPIRVIGQDTHASGHHALRI